MGWVSVRERGHKVACYDNWPLFYMNDFSRLGLVVDDLAKACQLYLEYGGTLRLDEGGALVEIEHYHQLPQLMAFFREHAIHCESADLVSCAYQG